MQKGIEWQFKTLAASHHSGIWERTIRSVRKVLYRLLKEQNVRLDDEGLCTLFCEAEAIVNSRPLTNSKPSAAIADRKKSSPWSF
jgi:hypothetical protein